MLKARPGKTTLLTGIFAAILICGFVWLSLRHPSAIPPEAPAVESSNPTTSQRSVHVSDATRRASDDARSPAEDEDPTKIPRDEIEAYLDRHSRSLESLLVAFRASGDTNYLREAATRFPDRPELQWTILARDAFPEERRQWLDRFKASSPENSLANYLSAREHFRDGNSAAALNELIAAGSKTEFKDYAMEAHLGGEELARESGKEGLMSATVGMSAVAEDLIPSLAQFKGLADEMLNLQKRYVEAGDSGSAANMAVMGLALADRFKEGEGSRYLIAQITGVRLEAMVLQALDQNTPYAFLDNKTPAQVANDQKQQREELRSLMRTLGRVAAELTPAEWVNYSERLKIYGEREALRWLQQRYPDPASSGE